MSSKVLVTGGAGFLGSHLCERLLYGGAQVLCVDNFYTGQLANVEHMIGHPDFKLIHHDITHPLRIKVDKIYNLACPASPIHYQRDPVFTTKVSVLGALNMLELAKYSGARILQASTSEIYGDPEIHPQPEDYAGHVSLIGPRSCYDEGKRCAETLFYNYHRQYEVDIRVARIFNTYGPRMQPNDGRVVPNFIIQALRNEPITLYGNGTQTRSFCYVDDLVTGLIRLMDCERAIGLPTNIGNPQEYTVRALAEEILVLTGRSVEIIHHPLPQDDPQQRRPDIKRAHDLLGWEPSIGLREGLKLTIDFFKLSRF